MNTLTQNANNISGNTVLNSLVINTPYKFDTCTTSPTIDKIFALPFGVRASADVLIRSTLNISGACTALLLTICFVFNLIYVPLNIENAQLLSTSKTLTNTQYNLIASAQEASNYNKIFESASSYKFIDANEVIHVKNKSQNLKAKTKTKLNKYPSVHYSGF